MGASSTDAAASAAGTLCESDSESEESEVPITSALMVQEERKTLHYVEEQGRAHDYRGAGAQCARQHFFQALITQYVD